MFISVVTCFHEAGYNEGLEELLGELLQTVQGAGRRLRLVGGHQPQLPGVLLSWRHLSTLTLLHGWGSCS